MPVIAIYDRGGSGVGIWRIRLPLIRNAVSPLVTVATACKLTVSHQYGC